METNEILNNEIIHIFDYYDFPLFFISRSADNSLYLNYYVEELDNELHKWIYSKISSNELKQLLCHQTSVLDLLNKLLHNSRLFYLTQTNSADQLFNLEPVNISNFDKDSFPVTDFYVEYDYITKQKLTPQEDDVIDGSDFSLILRDKYNSHDIELTALVSTLDKFKNALIDISSDVAKSLLGKDSYFKPNITITTFRPSSFAINLKSVEAEQDMFEITNKSLSNLYELFIDVQSKSESEIIDLIELDSKYSIESIKSTRKLLQEFKNLEYGFSFRGISKKHKVEKIVTYDINSYHVIEKLNQILSKKSTHDSEELFIKGELVSINLKYNKFRIITDKNIEVSGSMSKGILRLIKKDKTLKFTVPSYIEAMLIREITTNHLKEEYNDKFTLIDFNTKEHEIYK